MASIAARLISSVVYGGTATYRSLIRYGFRPEWLRDTELQRCWRIIVEHVAEHRKEPSIAYIRERLPSFNPLTPEEVESETPAALSDILKRDYIQVKMYGLIDQAMEKNELDPIAAAEWIQDQVTQLTRYTSPMEIFDLSASVDDVMEEYDNASNALNVGLEYPWPALHHETLGMHPEEFILIYGRMKSMKTFMALKMACHAYLNSGARVLVISRELSKIQMRKRIVAILAAVSYGPWRKGRLSEFERQHVYSTLLSLVDMEAETYSPRNVSLSAGMRIISGHNKKFKGLDLVEAAIDEYQPDLVLDDGFYLAAHSAGGGRVDAMDWKVMTGLTQKAKIIASQSKVTYMATTQANRSSTKSSKQQQLSEMGDNFSYADSFGQDCDLAIRVIKQAKNKEKGLPAYLLLGLPGYREGDMDAFAVHAQPCNNFNQFSQEDLVRFNVDQRIITRAKRIDDLKMDEPAGPTTNCDRYEREIPSTMSDMSKDVIPGTRMPKKRGK